MASTVKALTDKKLISPNPKWITNSVHYETIMGSVAYGVSSDSSDMDIYGFCIPPRDVVFPHLAGEIQGFGRQVKRFEQFQQHHVVSQDELGGKGREYDLSIYNIVKYFMLCMENNPNMIDSLFTSQECVLHITQIGNMVREKRRSFLHKGCWHKFKGYAYSQLHKMRTKDPSGRRKELRDKYGYDVKFAYHVVRLLSEVEQILSVGDLQLNEKGRREQMKAIRRGEVSEDEVRRWASDKEAQLEKLYHDSKLPYSPNESEIKKLLLECLEQHYGSLENCIVKPEGAVSALREVQDVLDRNRALFE